MQNPSGQYVLLHVLDSIDRNKKSERRPHRNEVRISQLCLIRTLKMSLICTKPGVFYETPGLGKYKRGCSFRAFMQTLKVEWNRLLIVCIRFTYSSQMIIPNQNRIPILLFHVVTCLSKMYSS